MNTDQRDIHFVPIGESRRWETKEAKHIKVHGTKKQVSFTATIFSAANGHYLPFQVIFQDTTTKKFI